MNGGWSPWGEWSKCDCVTRMMYRERRCDNPEPAGRGLACFGAIQEVKYATIKQYIFRGFEIHISWVLNIYFVGLTQHCGQTWVQFHFLIPIPDRSNSFFEFRV